MALVVIIGIVVGIAALMLVAFIMLPSVRIKIAWQIVGGSENRDAPQDLTDTIFISTVLARLSVRQSKSLIPDSSYDIDADPVRIGSGGYDDIIIPDKGVASGQAEIRLGDHSEFYVFALQDEYPVLVNGQEVGPDGIVLRDSDVIGLASDIVIVFYTLQQTAPLRSPIPDEEAEQIEDAVEQTRGIKMDETLARPKMEESASEAAPPPAPSPATRPKASAQPRAEDDAASKKDSKESEEESGEGALDLSVGGDVGGDVKIASGDIVDGDKITVGDITGSEGVAIGAGARASVAKTEVHGDVQGDVIQAGGNVMIINKEQALKHETQSRRFDAAFPEKVRVKEPVSLWVAVARPSDPPPFEDITSVKLDDVKKGPTADIDLPVDPKTGKAQEVYIDVQVQAPRFEPARDSATLTVHPDGKPDKVRFLLEPQQAGKGQIVVQFYHDKKRLGEIELTSAIEKARAGKKLALTFQIASLYFAFGAG